MRGLALILMLLPMLATAGEQVVVQKNKAFSVKALTIHVNDSVSFRNEDTFVHNIFSLSDDLPFDLGTYPQGQAKSVTFAKAGQYEVECAIHPEMKMVVTVKP